MLPVIQNFQDVIEHRDIHRMGKELYDFLILYCGFIAHYNIHGFRDSYSGPQDFADVFIRHFDRQHLHYHPIYECHNTPYKETGLTKADIKRAFADIVDRHKQEIRTWAKDIKRNDRYMLYLVLKKEFEGGSDATRT